MILVDIYIPSLDKNYDFQVDENVSIKSLILEITEMIENETNKVLDKVLYDASCHMKNGYSRSDN